MADDDDLKLAKKIRAELQENPDLTVADLGRQLQADGGDVARILDSYLVSGESVEWAGPGRGGGWTS